MGIGRFFGVHSVSPPSGGGGVTLGTPGAEECYLRYLHLESVEKLVGNFPITISSCSCVLVHLCLCIPVYMCSREIFHLYTCLPIHLLTCIPSYSYNFITDYQFFCTPIYLHTYIPIFQYTCILYI